DGIGRAVAAQLTVIDLQAGHALHGAAHHGQAILGGHLRGVPVRRSRAGNQPHLVELEQFGHLHCAAQVADMRRVEGAAQDADAFDHQPRTCPSPNTTYFSLVRPSRPTGPRACSLSVEMPISAPRPYSKPSAKRVEALTITELESTSVRKRRASVKFSVMMASVCCEP